MPDDAAAAPALGSPNVSPPATGPAPAAPGTPPQSPGAPAPAVAPDAQGQPAVDHAARIADLEKQLADVEALDPLLQVLSQHPEAVRGMVDGSFQWGASAAPNPAAAAAAVAPEGGGEYQDPRVSALAEDFGKLRRQNDDLYLEIGMARGEREFGDKWDRKAILRQIAQTGVTDPREAYFALRGRELSDEAKFNAIVDERVNRELASRAAAAAPSPAGVAGPAGGQPGAPAAGDENLIGPALRQSIKEEAANSGMASPPGEVPETG